MAGKGSRQRTYGAKFDDNYDRIFGKKADPIEGSESLGIEWVAEIDQYPQEARECAQRANEELSGDGES